MSVAWCRGNMLSPCALFMSGLVVSRRMKRLSFEVPLERIVTVRSAEQLAKTSWASVCRLAWRVTEVSDVQLVKALRRIIWMLAGMVMEVREVQLKKALS